METVSTPAEKLQALKEQLGRLDKKLHNDFLAFQENPKGPVPEETDAVKKQRDDLNQAIISMQQVVDGEICEDCVARKVSCKPPPENSASKKCEQCTILGTACTLEGH